MSSLGSVIRDAVAEQRLKDEPFQFMRPDTSFQPTGLDLGIVDFSNVRSQECIQKLKQQAEQNGVEFDNFRNICSIVHSLRANLKDRVFRTPASLSVAQQERFKSFERVLVPGYYEFADDEKLYIYGARSDIGDRTAIDQMLLVAVYQLEGLTSPVIELYNPDSVAGKAVVFSSLTNIATKCCKLSHEAFEELDKRLLNTPDAEDLMLRIVSMIRTSARILESHSHYQRIPMLNGPETDCQRQVKALTSEASVIHNNLIDLQKATGFGVPNYGRGNGSDATAVKELKAKLAELKNKMYDPVKKMVKDSDYIEPDTTIACAKWFGYEVTSLQCQLFQRLRPANEPCFGTLKLETSGDIGSAGEWLLDDGNFYFWCQSCDTDMRWSRVSQRPSVARDDCKWKATTGEVHDQYAVLHHLPGRHSNNWTVADWKGKGKMRFYCGYCCTWTLGTPVDANAVFNSFSSFERHLRANYNVKDGNECCVAM